MSDRSPGSALLEVLQNVFAEAGGLNDINVASGGELDAIASNYGMFRSPEESDASFRNRIRRHPLLKPSLIEDIAQVAEVLKHSEDECTCGNPSGGTHQRWCRKGLI